MGTQACGAGGTFGACACTGPSDCAPGALFACTCSDGSRGAQECGVSGVFGACACEAPPPAPSCVPGAAVPCACTDGATGAQVCSPEGAFGVCECEPRETGCVPGRSIACACSDGSTGAQVCAADGTYGTCSCADPDAGIVVLDSGLEDAGVIAPRDAGLPDANRPDSGPRPDGGVCDPYLGDTCGCVESRPPSTPVGTRPATGSIASGTETFVDLFVAPSGYIVVLADKVLLRARSGAELARWVAPREIRSASFDGELLAIADRAAVTALDASLAVVSTTFLTEECASSVAVSCGHFVCGPSNDWDRIFYTYDLASGGEIARSMPETYNGIPMRRVPGVDAFLTASVSLSPSDFHFYRVDPDGTAVFTTESPYHGDFAVTDVYAFRGYPATHVVTHEGRMLRIDECLGAMGWGASGRCLELDGSLGTLRTGERFLAMDTGADGMLYAIAGTGGTFSSDPLCPTGCRLQRIDAEARTIVSERTLTAPPRNARLRHDAWGGRVVLGGGSSCSTSYPYACSGWAISVAAYD